MSANHHIVLAHSAVTMRATLPPPLSMPKGRYSTCSRKSIDTWSLETQRKSTVCNSGSQNFNRGTVLYMAPGKDRTMNQQLRSIPAEQQEQNCEAMPSTNADATVTLVDRIKSAFDDALTELIAKRDSAYADATAPLEAKGNALSEEYDE